MNFAKEKINGYVIMREEEVKELHKALSSKLAISCACLWGPMRSGRHVILKMYASLYKSDYVGGIWYFDASSYLTMGRCLQEMVVDMLGTEPLVDGKGEKEGEVSLVMNGIPEIRHIATKLIMELMKSSNGDGKALFIVRLAGDTEMSLNLITVLPQVNCDIILVSETPPERRALDVGLEEMAVIKTCEIEPLSDEELSNFFVEELLSIRKDDSSEGRELAEEMSEILEYNPELMAVVTKYLAQVDAKTSFQKLIADSESLGNDMFKLVFIRLRSLSLRSKQRNERVLLVNVSKYPVIVNTFDIIVLSCLMSLDLFTACRVHVKSYFNNKESAKSTRRTIFTVIDILNRFGFYSTSLGISSGLRSRIMECIFTVCPREEIKQYLRICWSLLNPILNDFSHYALATNQFSLLLVFLQLVESTSRYNKVFGKEFGLMNILLQNSLELISTKFHAFFYTTDPSERRVIGMYLQQSVQKIMYMTKISSRGVKSLDDHENHMLLRENLLAPLVRFNILSGEKDEAINIGGASTHEWSAVALADELLEKEKFAALNELYDSVTLSDGGGFSRATILEIRIIRFISFLVRKEFLDAHRAANDIISLARIVCQDAFIEFADIVVINSLILHSKLGKVGEAREMLFQLTQKCSSLRRDSPIRFSPSKMFLQASSNYAIGLIDFADERYEEAQNYFEKAFNESSGLAGISGPNLELLRIFIAKCLLTIGIVCLRHTGELKMAEKAIMRSIEEFTSLDRPKYVCDSYSILAEFHLKNRSVKKAISASKKAIGALKERKSDIPPSLVDAYMTLGIALRDRGDVKTGIMMCRYAVSQRGKLCIREETQEDSLNALVQYRFRDYTLPMIVLSSFELPESKATQAGRLVEDMITLAEMYERSKHSKKALKYYKKAKDTIMKSMSTENAVGVGFMEQILAAIVRLQIDSEEGAIDGVEHALEFQLKYISMLRSVEDKERTTRSEHEFQNNIIAAELDAVNLLLSNDDLRDDDETEELLDDLSSRIDKVIAIGEDPGLMVLEEIVCFRIGMARNKMMNFLGAEPLLRRAVRVVSASKRTAEVRTALARSNTSIIPINAQFNEVADSLSSISFISPRVPDSARSMYSASGISDSETSQVRKSSYRSTLERFDSIEENTELLYFETGYTLYMQGKTEAACDIYRQGVIEVDAKALSSGTLRRFVSHYKNYADALRDTGNLDLSDLYIKKALEVVMFEARTKSREEFASDRDDCQAMASLYVGVSQNALAREQLDKSIKYLTEAIQLIEGKDFDLESSMYNSRLAFAYRQAGDYEKAFEYMNASLRLRIQLYGPNHLIVAKTYERMGEITLHFGKEDAQKAQNYFKAALSIINRSLLRKRVREGLTWVGRIHFSLGEGFKDFGEYSAAIMQLNEAVSFLEERDEEGVTEEDRVPYITANAEDGMIFNDQEYAEEAKVDLAHCIRHEFRRRKKCSIL